MEPHQNNDFMKTAHRNPMHIFYKYKDILICHLD